MKRFIYILVALVLAFALSACSIHVTPPPSGDGNTVGDATGGAAGGTPSNNDGTPSGGNEDDTDKPSGDTLPPVSMEGINNGVLENAALSAMDVPENMKLIGTNEATEENNGAQIEATAVLYVLDGDVVSWKTENDLIFVITKNNNRLVVIDTRSMSPVCNTPLSGVPAEMNFVGDMVAVSFPDLCRVDFYNKNTCEKEGTLFFEHEISSFCFDGDHIYYSEHDQHCRVFRKNLVTGELLPITTENSYTFYEPKLLFNGEDGILYIGETESTGSTLYYFDAETLTVASAFRKNDYGILNHTREIIHVGDEIFWGSFRLSDTNAKELHGRYGGANSWGSVTFASETLVSTYEGLFLTETYECVIDYARDGFEYLLVTDSNHVFFRQRSGDKNVILGLNFALQEAFEKFDETLPPVTT